MRRPELEALGDQALLLRWSDQADIGVNRQVQLLASKLRSESPGWLVDCVPAYASLAVFFDQTALTGVDAVAEVGEFLFALVQDAESSNDATESRLVEIGVCYGGAYGPDLDDVADHCGLTATQVVDRHSQAEYLVAMLGFAPGFPYLLGLDETLAMPRLATPRTRVPAGSVGIGGSQTGIYPTDGPGGWRLIGRTPHILFDAMQQTPSLLLPGDRVRFTPIEPTRCDALARAKA